MNEPQPASLNESPPPVIEKSSRLQRMLRELIKAPFSAKLGLLIIFVYVFVAVFAPVLAPFGESEIVGKKYMLWDDEFLLGTDNLGRDVLSRIIYGARNTVGIALVTTIYAFLLGVILGIVAAVIGGWVDQLLSRIVVGLGLIAHGANLVLLGSGGPPGAAPILEEGEVVRYSDPLEQAMVLTAIVISMAVTLYLLANMAACGRAAGTEDVVRAATSDEEELAADLAGRGREVL